MKPNEPLSGAAQTGPGGIALGGHLRALTAAAAVWGVARRAPVLVVDAANRFDPYQLVREAGAAKLSPHEALTGCGWPGPSPPTTGAPPDGNLPGESGTRQPGAGPGTGEPVLR